MTTSGILLLMIGSCTGGMFAGSYFTRFNYDIRIPGQIKATNFRLKELEKKAKLKEDALAHARDLRERKLHAVDAKIL